jgi:glycosyltransferase involved in cell wall biosynthesis
LKILFITPSLYPTGPVKVFLTLATRLREKGQEVFFWYFDELENVNDERGEKIQFNKFKDASGFDIVQSVGLRPDLYVRRFHKKFKCPTVTTMENYVEEDLKFEYNTIISKFFSPVWKFGTKKHDGFVTLQNHMKDYYNRKWGVKSSDVIANCSEVKVEPAIKNIENRILEHKRTNILLGSIGYVTERKGLRQVVKLLNLREDFYWVHFGGGKSLESTKKMANDLGVEERVLFLGKVPNASSYLKLLDVFVMPSYSEGMPLSMLEAVMQKIPCVSTNIDLFKSIFSNEESGQFEPDNIEMFSEDIDRVLESKKSFIEKSFLKYNNEYSPDVVSNKYIELYKRLINEQK